MFFSPSLIIFLFSSFALVSSAVVITATNPVHSVFALIFVFVNVASVLLVLRVEFISLLFLVVYVGAVAVLFLFVIMMLNVKLNEASDNSVSYLPLGLVLGVLFLLEVSLIITGDLLPFSGGFLYRSEISQNLFAGSPFSHLHLESVVAVPNNMQLIGSVVYTDLFFPFILAGLLLLLSMIGAIVLSLMKTSSALKQDIFKQVSVLAFESIRV
uniref:NADH-ubiquinone oxidoreductase chain 6 n=2 Tax=Pavlovaceae TaxID=418969 RepID=E9P6B2_DIALT|nr:NADH dehydrogenase subunit 6 [Diacronema lutheri]QHD45370.1 NADH dehydrogenase subunit 6 [Pavlova sp. NIVA-4/92]